MTQKAYAYDKITHRRKTQRPNDRDYDKVGSRFKISDVLLGVGSYWYVE